MGGKQGGRELGERREDRQAGGRLLVWAGGWCVGGGREEGRACVRAERIEESTHTHTKKLTEVKHCEGLSAG